MFLDTNALIRAHGRIPTRARKLLGQLLQGGHDLILSNEMLAEATKVLRYPRFRSLYGLTDADLLDYRQFLQSIAHMVALDPRYRAPLRDPNDWIVLQTAELGEVDILCTFPVAQPAVSKSAMNRTLLARLARVN